MAKENVVVVPIPETSTSNNRTVKYVDTGINQSKGFIDSIRNSLFTVRNKKLVEKEFMVKGGKFKEVVLPNQQAANGILRSIKKDCRTKFDTKVATLVDADYNYLLANQNDKFKADHPEFYTDEALTDENKAAINEIVFEQTMYSIQTNLQAKVQ